MVWHGRFGSERSGPRHIQTARRANYAADGNRQQHQGEKYGPSAPIHVRLFSVRREPNKQNAET
ncbi:hypothetical protein MTsPCn3_14830 [Erythrobacter sp. MTPC3]